MFNNLVYLYTIIATVLKIWNPYNCMDNISWIWVIAPFWIAVLGPWVFKALFKTLLSRQVMNIHNMHEINFGIKKKFFLEIADENILLDIRGHKLSGYPSEHRTTTIHVIRDIVNRKALLNLANSLCRKKNKSKRC